MPLESAESADGREVKEPADLDVKEADTVNED